MKGCQQYQRVNTSPSKENPYDDRFKNNWAEHEIKYPLLLSHINQYFLIFSVQLFSLHSLLDRLQRFYRQMQFFTWNPAVGYALLTALQHCLWISALTPATPFTARKLDGCSINGIIIKQVLNTDDPKEAHLHPCHLQTCEFRTCQYM